jgi:hypothetical protein
VILHSINEEMDVGDTEDALQSFWDKLIYDSLKMALARTSMKYGRNTNRMTETGSNRPDSSLLIGDYCIFRGEEKKSRSLEKPGDELVKKLTWNYGSLPYILGYYAVGFDVKLCAIYQEHYENKVMKMDISDTFNLRYAFDRTKLVTAMFNIAPILVNLANLCGSSGAVADLICNRPTKKVSLQGIFAYKCYKHESIFNRVKSIYR